MSDFFGTLMQDMPEGAEGLEQLLGAINGFKFPVMLALVIGLGFFAYFGYSLFRKALSIVGAVIFGAAGSMYIAPFVISSLGESAPANIDVSVIVGLVCAVLGAVLINFLYKVALFVFGAFFGYTAGTLFLCPMLAQITKSEWFLSQTGLLVTGILLALLVGALCVFLFKPIFIVVSSVPGMTCAGVMLGTSIFVEAGETLTIICAVVGLLVGIHAASYQFKHGEN